MVPERLIALPGYTVCAWLVFFPVLDAVALVIPPDPTSLDWRYVVVSIMSRALITPLLGVFLAVVIAATLDHRAVLRLLAVLALVWFVCILGALVVFVPDSLAMADVQRAGLLPAFGLGWALAVGKLAFAVVFFGLSAWTTRRLGWAPAEDVGMLWKT